MIILTSINIYNTSTYTVLHDSVHHLVFTPAVLTVASRRRQNNIRVIRILHLINITPLQRSRIRVMIQHKSVMHTVMPICTISDHLIYRLRADPHIFLHAIKIPRVVVRH